MTDDGSMLLCTGCWAIGGCCKSLWRTVPLIARVLLWTCSVLHFHEVVVERFVDSLVQEQVVIQEIPEVQVVTRMQVNCGDRQSNSTNSGHP